MRHLMTFKSLCFYLFWCAVWAWAGYLHHITLNALSCFHVVGKVRLYVKPYRIFKNLMTFMHCVYFYLGFSSVSVVPCVYLLLCSLSGAPDPHVSSPRVSDLSLLYSPFILCPFQHFPVWTLCCLPSQCGCPPENWEFLSCFTSLFG